VKISGLRFWEIMKLVLKYGSREKRVRCQLDGSFFGGDDEHVEGCQIGDGY